MEKTVTVTSAFSGADQNGPRLNYSIAFPTAANVPAGTPLAPVMPLFSDSIANPTAEQIALIKQGATLVLTLSAPSAS